MKLLCLIFSAIAITAGLDALPADPAVPKVPEKVPDPSALSKAMNNSQTPDPTNAISKIKGAARVGDSRSPGADIAQQMVKTAEAMVVLPIAAGKNIMEDVGKMFNPGAIAKGAPSVPDANATKAVQPPSKLPESPFKPQSVVSAASSFANGMEDMFGAFGL